MISSDNGGIDLGKTQVAVRAGSGKVVTAFDDPAQLQMLLHADGLLPVIYSIKPAPASLIKALLGL